MEFLASTTISIVLAILLSILFELPFGKLEDLFFGFLKEKKTNKVKENGNDVIFAYKENGGFKKDDPEYILPTISEIQQRKDYDPSII